MNEARKAIRVELSKHRKLKEIAVLSDVHLEDLVDSILEEALRDEERLRRLAKELKRNKQLN